MTVKNLERIAYFASYVVTSIDLDAKAKLLSDKEAEFNAAKEAIKARYEAEAKEEGSNVKALAQMQTKEIEELEKQYTEVRDQLTMLDKLVLLSESDYRNLPDDVAEIITVGMGGTALAELLKEIDLSELIEGLRIEAEEAKGQRKKKVMKRLRLLESMERAGISQQACA